MTTSDERKQFRTREIFDNAVCALVIEHQVSANVAAKMFGDRSQQGFNPARIAPSQHGELKMESLTYIELLVLIEHHAKTGASPERMAELAAQAVIAKRREMKPNGLKAIA